MSAPFNVNGCMSVLWENPDNPTLSNMNYCTFLLFVFWAFSICSAHAAELERQSSDLLRTIYEECGTNRACYLQKSDSLWSYGSCREREAAFTICAELAPNRLPLWIDQLPSCKNTFPRYHIQLGAIHFHNGNFSEALSEFTQGELEGHQPVCDSYANLGATYFALKEWEFAIGCFEDSWTETDKSDFTRSYMILNNLAAIHLRFQKPNEALFWVEKAKSNLVQMLDAAQSMPKPETFETESMVIAVNEFGARTLLNDTAFVRKQWRNINWGSPDIQAQDWLNLILQAAPLIDDQAFYMSQARILGNIFSEFERTNSDENARTGSFALLADYHERWPDDLAGMVTFWKELTEIQRLIRFKNQASMHSTEGDTTVVALMLANSVVLLVGVSLIIKRLRSKKMDESFLREQMHTLRNWPTHGREKKRHAAKIDALAFWVQNIPPKYPFPDDFELSESEWIAFRSAEENELPKSLAMRKRWTPSYVYSLRSSIRRKIGVSDSNSLESWIERNRRQK